MLQKHTWPIQNTSEAANSLFILLGILCSFIPAVRKCRDNLNKVYTPNLCTSDSVHRERYWVDLHCSGLYHLVLLEEASEVTDKPAVFNIRVGEKSAFTWKCIAEQRNLNSLETVPSVTLLAQKRASGHDASPVLRTTYIHHKSLVFPSR